MCIGGAGEWSATTAGGIAYVGSWGNRMGQPAFVFPNNLGRRFKAVWEATSHEIGHTMGLRHDGVMGGPAYFGGRHAGAVLTAAQAGVTWHAWCMLVAAGCCWLLLVAAGCCCALGLAAHVPRRVFACTYSPQQPCTSGCPRCARCCLSTA